MAREQTGRGGQGSAATVWCLGLSAWLYASPSVTHREMQHPRRARTSPATKGHDHPQRQGNKGSWAKIPALEEYIFHLKRNIHMQKMEQNIHMKPINKNLNNNLQTLGENISTWRGYRACP